MSQGPDLALQGAIVAKLQSDTVLQGLIGNPIRLYEFVPANPTFPYITIGDGQNVPDQQQFRNGSEVFVPVHVWSRPSNKGYGECKRIGDAIEDALNDAALTLDNNRCVEIERDGARYLRDQDNVTVHGIVDFRALTEPA